VKSVPGCFVLIVPRRIGDPVAALPGVGPHDEMSTLLVPPPELVLEPAEVELCAPPLLLLELLLLLPHPTSSNRSPAIAARAIHDRDRERRCIFTVVLSSVDVVFG
jgi:hypothetical protein